MCVVYRGLWGARKQGEHGGVELYYIRKKRKEHKAQAKVKAMRPMGWSPGKGKS